MTDFLPKDVLEGLKAARKRDLKRRAHRRVHVGDEVYPILDYGEDGFAVDAETAPRLRGLVDIYDGPRHLYQALIMASAHEGDLMRYEYKRNTPAADHPPVDFEHPDLSAIALLSDRSGKT
ncbi:hypothetical protein E2K80_14425 [Rhodophyticola sp. CCM32]|uniref:hypothetical protein n=1 Tax=Rhodophyticola sp. CCM32 TaxID=2916397 RepID=UPI00107F58EF|nr:hypothetical protein [Rhodophyticola sp. CCM32]QBY01771.1 hypothetical protein E2K80_14425 [Rhodophyticola sp. CCM32]